MKLISIPNAFMLDFLFWQQVLQQYTCILDVFTLSCPDYQATDGLAGFCMDLHTIFACHKWSTCSTNRYTFNHLTCKVI